MEAKTRKIKVLKKLLIIILLIVLISVLLTIGIGNYFVNYAILRSGDGGNREIKNEDAIEVASIDNETEKIIEENRKIEQELAKNGLKILVIKK